MSGENDKPIIEMNRDEKGQFIPGKSGNPSGGPKIYSKPLKLLDQKRYEQAVRFVSSMSFKELSEGLSNANSPQCPYDVFQLGIMSVWARIIEKGDIVRLESFLDRMIGVPIKRYLASTVDEETIKRFLLMPREDRQKEIDRLDKLAQEVGDE